MLVSVPRISKMKQTRTIPTVVVLSKKKRKQRLRPKLRLDRGLQLGGRLASDYYRCLTDPFNCSPVRAGFGTLVPTQIHTAYIRGSIPCSAGGNLSLFALPNQNNFLMASYAATSATVPTGTSSSLYAAANAATLNGLFDESRTLAFGLRLIPMIAATAVPGVISLGCAPRTDLQDLVAPNALSAINSGLANSSTDYINQMPYLREHMGRPGGVDYFQITWRPTDVRDFEFTPGDTAVVQRQGNVLYAPFYDVVANGTGATIARQDDSQGSFLVANLQGLPAGSIVYYEVILHLETVDSSKPIATTDFASTRSTDDSVASEAGGTFESFYRSIVNRLPNVDSVMGATTSLLSSPAVVGAATRYLNNRLMGVQSTGYEVIRRS